MVSPTATGWAEDDAALIRPRMYGSIERYRVRTSSCPLVGTGMRPVSTRKLSSVGAPAGRDAKTMRQYALINPLQNRQCVWPCLPQACEAASGHPDCCIRAQQVINATLRDIPPAIRAPFTRACLLSASNRP